jgi:glycosyltransferase involved in cell wall biosynthesis
MNVGVSVCVFTYNYEQYLPQALDSVLAQQTSFPVEIIVGDDCSTDNTRAVALEYSNRYPGRFILSFNETNIGGTRNWIRSMNKCSGRYIALLDGDDYFTDIHKLQKQYDALEEHPEYVLSFHGVEEKYDDISGQDKIVVFEKEDYTIGDFLERGWFIRTGSTFFRNGIAPVDPPAWVYDFPYRYDTILHVFLGIHGRALFLKDVMSVWRKHSKGMSKTFSKDRIRNIMTEIALARELDRYTDSRYANHTKAYIARAYSDLFFIILRSKDKTRHIALLARCMRQMDYARSFLIVQKKLSGSKTA